MKRYFLLMLAVIVLDQAVKQRVSSSMEVGESVPLPGGFVSITFIKNTGAAFSMLEGKTLFLCVLPVIIAAAVIVVLLKYGRYEHPVFLSALSLIAAGGIGNVIDRVREGAVTDMIDFHFFPVFNVADIAVCTGCGLMALYILMLEPRERKSRGSRRR